ncbi:MAG: DISARM system helicase DrmA, partial [Gammaproteobacteria bacterium]
MTTATDIRASLIEALQADLVGPFYPPNGDNDEVLPLPPSRWYLTGFLAPQGNQETEDPTAEEELGAGPDEDNEDAAGQEPEPKQKHRFPASLGLSVLLPPASQGNEPIRATVRFAEYIAETREDEAAKRSKTVWRRVPRDPMSVDLPLEPGAIEPGQMLPGAAGIWVRGRLETAEAPGLEVGTRALSLFVVNQRGVGERGRQDEPFIFQVELELEYAGGFVARPNRQGEHVPDWDDRVADLQFRNRFEYAVGHGVSVEVLPQGEKVTRVRTSWLPRFEVRRVVTGQELSVVTEMERLASLADGEAAKAALLPLVDAYGRWLDGQSKTVVDSDARRATRDQLIKNAAIARQRIRSGIERLASDLQAFDAFRLANQAMVISALKRTPERYQEGNRPAWRLFQLAFLLL